MSWIQVETVANIYILQHWTAAQAQSVRALELQMILSVLNKQYKIFGMSNQLTNMLLVCKSKIDYFEQILF